jgi:hypothetical protein
MDPETLSAACHILANHWGGYGYRVESIEPAGYNGAGVLSVRHSDGSRFALGVDRYACHHAAETHDGTEYDEARAMIAAALAAGELHKASITT